MSLWDATPAELASLFPRLCPDAETRVSDTTLVKKLVEEWEAQPWEIAYGMVLLADNSYPRNIAFLYSRWPDFLEVVFDKLEATVEVILQLFPEKTAPLCYRKYRDFRRGRDSANESKRFEEVREELNEWCTTNERGVVGTTGRRGRTPRVSDRG